MLIHGDVGFSPKETLRERRPQPNLQIFGANLMSSKIHVEQFDLW